jgi:hypothetical protein
MAQKQCRLGGRRRRPGQRPGTTDFTGPSRLRDGGMLCSFSAVLVEPLQPCPSQNLHPHRVASFYGSIQAPMRGYQYSSRRLLNTLAEQSNLSVKLPEMLCVAVHSVAPRGWALLAHRSWPTATKLPVARH